MNIDLHQTVVLEDEAGIAIRYIKEGFAKLENEFRGNNETSHMVLLHLAQGFERLLKIVFVFRHYSKYSKFPTEKEFKKEYSGHDILWLWEKLLTLLDNDYILGGYDAIEHSITWLQNDEKFYWFLELLSGFGDHNRYFNLNYVIGMEKDFYKSPPQLLSISYNKWIEDQPEWERKLLKKGNDNFREDYIKLLREYCLHFSQVLCRLLGWGAVGPDAARICTGKIGDFLLLSEQQIIHNDNIKFT